MHVLIVATNELVLLEDHLLLVAIGSGHHSTWLTYHADPSLDLLHVLVHMLVESLLSLHTHL